MEYFYQWESETLFKYKVVTANLDSSGGGYDKLPAGDAYRQYIVAQDFRYSIGRWGSLISAEYGFAESQNNNYQRTNGQLHLIGFGVDRIFYPLRSWIFIPRFKFNQTLYSNSLDQDIVAVADGVSFLDMGVYSLSKLKWAEVFFDLNYKKRATLSDLFIATAGLKISIFGTKVNPYLQYLDSISKETESTGLVLQRQNWNCLANGCSHEYMSVNPQKISFGVKWDFNPRSQTRWSGFVEQTLGGRSAGYSTQVGIILTLFGNYKTPKIDHFTSDFVEDTQTEIDQKLFQPPQIIDPMKAPKEDKQPDRQKTLDQIEMQIKLKKVKEKSN